MTCFSVAESFNSLLSGVRPFRRSEWDKNPHWALVESQPSVPVF